MGLKMQKKAVIPPGSHTGEIIGARQTTKTFDPAIGAEPVIEITIAPAYKVPDAATLPVSVIFTPELNGLSALSKFLGRVGVKVAEGEDWEPSSLTGTKVAFTSKDVNGFVRIEKDTLRKA